MEGSGRGVLYGETPVFAWGTAGNHETYRDS
jgi:hypothetical protein